MALYDRVAGLPVVVESVELERLAIELPAFTRATTVVRLRGGGETGVGEDVTYDTAEHDDPPRLPVEGRWASLDELSRAFAEAELFRESPDQQAYLDYRRWAWESAALDLALRQAGVSLAEALERPVRPVRFVLSPRIAEPPSPEPVPGWLHVDGGLRFKLDPTPDWTEDLAHALAAMNAVDVLDLKGQYRGTVVDNPPDPGLYRLVAETFPDAWIEDPNLDDPAADAALEPHRDRITWDAPIHSVADVEALPFPPRMLNVKPSRFGTVGRLLDTFDYCAAREITTYGGGQFELGPGRGQIQYVASLFSPDAPNDVAPAAYNAGGPRAGLPTTPLEPAAAPTGFAWG